MGLRPARTGRLDCAAHRAANAGSLVVTKKAKKASTQVKSAAKPLHRLASQDRLALCYGGAQAQAPHAWCIIAPGVWAAAPCTRDRPSLHVQGTEKARFVQQGEPSERRCRMRTTCRIEYLGPLLVCRSSHRDAQTTFRGRLVAHALTEAHSCAQHYRQHACGRATQRGRASNAGIADGRGRRSLPVRPLCAAAAPADTAAALRRAAGRCVGMAGSRGASNTIKGWGHSWGHWHSQEARQANDGGGQNKRWGLHGAEQAGSGRAVHTPSSAAGFTDRAAASTNRRRQRQARAVGLPERLRAAAQQ